MVFINIARRRNVEDFHEVRSSKLTRSVDRALLVILISLSFHIVAVAGMLTGPSECTSDGNTVGYSDLAALRTDILLNSVNDTSPDGGRYILCPNSIFNFSDVVPVSPPSSGDDILVFDDDILGGGVNVGTQPPITVDEIQAITITSNNTELLCGNDGLSSNGCVFVDGSFHILISGGPTGILVAGLTFRLAKKSSIVYLGPGGDSVFRNCIWQVRSPSLHYYWMLT